MARTNITNAQLAQELRETRELVNALAELMMTQAPAKKSAPKKARAKKAAKAEELVTREYKGVVTVGTMSGPKGGFVADHYEVGGKVFGLDKYAEAKEAAKKAWIKAQGYTAKDIKAFATEKAEQRAEASKKHEAYEATCKHFGKRRVSSKTWHKYYDEVLATL